MTRPVMDQVSLGKTFEGSSGLLQCISLPVGQREQLKGLLTLIPYLIPALSQVCTLANRPGIRISSFVQERGLASLRGLRFVFLHAVDKPMFP